MCLVILGRRRKVKLLSKLDSNAAEHYKKPSIPRKFKASAENGARPERDPVQLLLYCCERK